MAKERKKSDVAVNEQERAIDDLAEYVIESLRGEFHSELEPFEAYAARLRKSIVADVRLFRQRFHRGYHVLMTELAREKKGK